MNVILSTLGTFPTNTIFDLARFTFNLDVVSMHSKIKPSRLKFDRI